MAALDKSPAAVLFEATASARRSAEIFKVDDVYGWLVGNWELAIERYWGKDVAGQITPPQPSPSQGREPDDKLAVWCASSNRQARIDGRRQRAMVACQLPLSSPPFAPL
jgi:hypothetical protein